MNETTARLLDLALRNMTAQTVTTGDDGTITVVYVDDATIADAIAGKVCAWCGITPVTDRRARCENCR